MTTINTLDRRAFLFGDTPVAPPARTPTQQQAARVNGAKSHGPITRDGLARSSANATKHGLLSKFIAPPDDARGYGELYSRIRRGLLAELAPSSFFARSLIDTLAFDLVDLTRAQGMMETMFPAPAIQPEEDRAWRGTRWAKAACRRASAALEHLKTGNPWEMPEASARRLARQLADLLAAVEADLADAADPESVTEDIDIELRRPQTTMVEAVGAYRKKLGQPDYLEGIFTGRQRLRPRQRARLQAVLEFAVTSARDAMTWGPDEKKRIRERNGKALATVAAAPERLVLLQRYATRLARSIERQYRFLRQR